MVSSSRRYLPGVSLKIVKNLIYLPIIIARLRIRNLITGNNLLNVCVVFYVDLARRKFKVTKE